MKKKLYKFCLLFLLYINLNSLVLEEKIKIKKIFDNISTLIQEKQFDKVIEVIEKIKISYFDTEFIPLANYYLSIIECENKNFYKALFYIESTIKDKNFNLLTDYYKKKIFFIAGYIYYKLENIDSAIYYFTEAIDDENSNRINLYLSNIYYKYLNNREKAIFYFYKIKNTQFINEDKDLYDFLSLKILWDKIDTSKISYKDPNVSSMLIDNDLIYIGLWNGGLLEYNYVTNNYKYYQKNIIISENIRALYLEKRYIYIGTAEGLTILDKRDKKFYNISELQNISITCITGNNDYIYFGTLYNSIIVYDKNKKNYFKLFESNLNISSIYCFNDMLFYGTYDGYFYLYNDGNVKLIGEKQIKVPITNILKIDNELWLTSYGKGIFKINLTNFEIKNYFSGNIKQIKDNYLLCLSYYKNKIYFGTLGKGIFYYDITEDKWDNFQISDLFTVLDVQTIVFSDNIIFIGTLGEGVIKKYLIFE